MYSIHIACTYMHTYTRVYTHTYSITHIHTCPQIKYLLNKYKLQILLSSSILTKLDRHKSLPLYTLTSH